MLVSTRFIKRFTSLTLLVILLVGVPMSVLNLFTEAQPTIILTPKWRRTSMGTNWESGLVIGDVTDDGQEDVVYCGGSSNVVYYPTAAVKTFWKSTAHWAVFWPRVLSAKPKRVR